MKRVCVLVLACGLVFSGGCALFGGDDKDRRELVGRAARTVMPSKAQKSVRKQGGEYVATYVEVDQNNVSTDMRPGKSGQYVGFIRYSEYEYECRGKSRQDALKGSQCERVRTRNLNEMIRYDGKKWQF